MDGTVETKGWWPGTGSSRRNQLLMQNADRAKTRESGASSISDGAQGSENLRGVASKLPDLLHIIVLIRHQLRAGRLRVSPCRSVGVQELFG